MKVFKFGNYMFSTHVFLLEFKLILTRKSVFFWVEGGICSCFGSLPALEPITPDDEDVLEEENTVKRQLSEGIVDSNVAVQIRGLAKTYPGAWKGNSFCCCKCKKTPPYHAVRVNNSFHFLVEVGRLNRKHNFLDIQKHLINCCQMH